MNAIVLNESELKEYLAGILSDFISNQQPKEKNDESELLSIDDVASLLRVHKQTIFNWKKRGIIPFKQIGRRVYYSKNAVLDSIKNLRY